MICYGVFWFVLTCSHPKEGESENIQRICQDPFSSPVSSIEDLERNGMGILGCSELRWLHTLVHGLHGRPFRGHRLVAGQTGAGGDHLPRQRGERRALCGGAGRTRGSGEPAADRCKSCESCGVWRSGSGRDL